MVKKKNEHVVRMADDVLLPLKLRLRHVCINKTSPSHYLVTCMIDSLANFS